MELTYYDYKKERKIGTDIETKDPELVTKGPGVYRKDGYVTGVSFSNGKLSEYYPINHPDTSAEEELKNRKFIEDQLASNNEKIFANALYDMDWMINYEGWKVNGKIRDIQIAEPLIDEYRRSYSLDNLAKSYLDKKKLGDVLKDYCKKMDYKITKSNPAISYLWRMPGHVAGEYGGEDAKLTYLIDEEQRVRLHNENLEGIYELELELLPMLLQMRKTGVRVDQGKLFKTGMQLTDLAYDLQQEMNNLSGFEINVKSGPDLHKLFKKNNYPVVYGEPTSLMLLKGRMVGNPRFDKETLSRMNNEVSNKILELRHITTLLNMFVHAYPELLVEDRLHCQFNPLRSDNYGTVSGRLSSSNPNLQQVSGKDEEEFIKSGEEDLKGQLIRKCFIPEDDCLWWKADWSQIEYRLIAHYAIGEGAEKIRKRYNEDPNVDYHDELGQMAGIDDRKVIKTLNFGAAYGMGVKTMSEKYGWDMDEASNIYKRYHSKVPFIKETSNRVALKAKRFGFIKTVLRRKARIPSSDKGYVMFNRLIQGSAADIMKKSMVDAYKAGIFNTLHPHMTVHDELDCSIPKTKEGTEAGKELKSIMEKCVPLKVPIISDCEIGENWGELEKWEV